MTPQRWLARLALVAGLLLLAGRAGAGDETQVLKGGIQAHVWSPWPLSVHKGWAPIFVELRNDSDKESAIEIEARGEDYFCEREVHTSVRIDPGKSASLELLVPLGVTYSSLFDVRVIAPEENAYFGGAVGSPSINPAVHQVLLLAESEPEAGALERWSSSLSTKAVEGEGFVGGGRRLVFSGSAGPRSASPDDVQVARARFADMPHQHAAYSSLDLVVIDPARGMPAEERMNALIAWVRTGGDLLVLGERGAENARSIPELAAWMEPRFETKLDQGSEYRCGLGRLFAGERDGVLGDGPYVEWVKDILAAEAGLTPERGKWRADAVHPTIPDLVRLPYRSFAALLILFALVIGPLNFIAVRRRKKPVLLLLTIPAIALLTTVALLAYGILFQGLDVKTASYSIAALDQRQHRSACVEARQLFAGLAPAAGLAVGPGTIVHDVAGDEERGFGGRRLAVELENGTLLGGDYLPSRTLTNQVLCVERAERARLDFKRRAGALSVDNSLGADVLELAVRDPDGGFYEASARLVPGASAQLVAIDEERAVALIASVTQGTLSPLARAPDHETELLPPGCYLARLEQSPFRDDCGIEVNELAGAHVVLGVLALDAEDWR